MKQLVTVLVGIACVVVIAAGGLWLWQQYDASERQAAASSRATGIQVTAKQCGEHMALLNRAAVEPPETFTQAQKDAATEGVIACRDRGIF